MSKQIRDTAVGVLEPLVGRAMATLYVADAASQVGMTSDEIEPGDVRAVCDVLRSKIGPFAARPVVDQAIEDIISQTRV